MINLGSVSFSDFYVSSAIYKNMFELSISQKQSWLNMTILNERASETGLIHYC